MGRILGTRKFMKQDAAKDRSEQAKAVEASVKRGVRRALIEHKQRGAPIVDWRDNQVVWVPANEVVIPDEPSEEGG